MAIKVLKPIEQIQRSPGMWIELNTAEGLVREVVENALDELQHGYADDVFVVVNRTDDSIRVTVADNGRGIDLNPVEVEDEKGNKELLDSIVAICCRLFSGEKFDKDVYKSSTGLHGVGLVVVNALSKYLHIVVKDRKNGEWWHYQFEKGIFVLKEKVNVSEDFDHYSTIVTFEPDPSYFYEVNDDLPIVKDELRLASIIYPEAKIKFNDEVIKDNIQNFIKEKINVDADDIAQVTFTLDNGDVLQYFFTIRNTEYSGSRKYGVVNLHPCDGYHIEAFYRLARYVINNLYPDLPYYVVDSLISVMCISWLLEPKFRGQSKTFLENADLTSRILSDKNVATLKKIIKEKFIQNIEEVYQSRFKRSIARKTKKVSSDNPIRDCKLKEVLYIVEGESAVNPLLDIRDPLREAILPLRGKFTNVWKKKKVDVKNLKRELKWILEAIGYPNNDRYNEIRILADPDPDGLHICILVLIGLSEFASDLINEGKVKIILPPLYIGKKGNKWFPIYNLADEKSKYSSIIRIKGLAQIPNETLRMVLDDKSVYYTVTMPDKERIKLLKEIVTSDIKKELLESEKLGLKKFMQILKNDAK